MRPFIVSVRPFGRHIFSCPAVFSRPYSLPAFQGFKCPRMPKTMEEMHHLGRCIETMGLERWGWVFYRCTYSDDEAWSRLKQKITQEMQEELEDSESPEITARLSKRLDLTFFEDKNAFDGASKDQLRTHFQQWAAGAFPIENPRGIEGPLGDSPFQRYRYFIQINADALLSINENPPRASGFPRGSYVNFIDAYWKPLNEKYLECPDPTLEKDFGVKLEERFEPIEGCVEENVGWMKLATINVCTEFYVNIGGTNDESWYHYYKRPPDIVEW